MQPAINLSNSFINPKFKHSIEQIAINAPQIPFIKNSFKSDLLRYIEIIFVKAPIIKAHKNVFILPPNNIEKVV